MQLRGEHTTGKRDARLGPLSTAIRERCMWLPVSSGSSLTCTHSLVPALEHALAVLDPSCAGGPGYHPILDKDCCRMHGSEFD